MRGKSMSQRVHIKFSRVQTWLSAVPCLRLSDGTARAREEAMTRQPLGPAT